MRFERQHHHSLKPKVPYIPGLKEKEEEYNITTTRSIYILHTSIRSIRSIHHAGTLAVRLRASVFLPLTLAG